MSKGNIVDSQTMRRLIAESHVRSREYGIDPVERDADQMMLSPAELAERKRKSNELLDVVMPQFTEFYDLLSPNDFLIAVADADGYILHMVGTEELVAGYATRNCAPSFRWTEQDVGTTAISMCLKHKIPIQLMGADHYCRRAHHLTSSAAPIFGQGRELVGVLVVSGAKELAHPHTLFMVTTAARAAERQLRILRRNTELALHVGFFDKVIESTNTGLMILNAEEQIWRVNKKGAEILQAENLVGRHIRSLDGWTLHLDEVRRNPELWVNKECWVRCDEQTVPLIYTAQIVLSEEGEKLGAVIMFQEMGEIQKLADNIAGAKAHFTFATITGRSAPFTEALDLAKKAAESSATVLLQGETGTGKEMFAQAIHNHGTRRQYPFVPINCGAIPAELLESELFGYVEGTFTGAAKGGRPGKFELANGGTILLDEIGDMPHHMQVKLLRVLQTGEVYRIGARKPVKIDTRIIASTHVDLTKAVGENRFREDLYYRLHVLPINIPPMRERGREDILSLARLFLSRNSSTPPVLSPEAKDALTSYHWPGNVRELENIIQRALHVCDGGELFTKHLGLPLGDSYKGLQQGTLEHMEQQMICKTLKEAHYNMAETARVLGISRATLYRKVKKYLQNGVLEYDTVIR